MLAGVPAMMGEHPGPPIAKGEASLEKIRTRALPPAPCLHARPPHSPRVRGLNPGLCLQGHAAMPYAPSPHAAGSGPGPDQAAECATERA